MFTRGPGTYKTPGFGDISIEFNITKPLQFIMSYTIMYFTLLYLKVYDVVSVSLARRRKLLPVV